MTISPEYSKIIAFGEAERIWSLYNFKSPQELILENLAMAMNIVVMEGALNSADARLIRKGKWGIVRLKQNILEPTRKRFAVAHEIGHWQLHPSDSQWHLCTSEDMFASYETNRIEAEANYFASALLMPEHIFGPLLKKQIFSLKTISSLASFFQTSLTATAIRFTDLSQDCCAIVCSKNGKVSWWRGSSYFEKRFWIRCGSNLSQDCLAMDILRDKVSRKCAEVGINVWSERGYSSGDGLYFVEEAFYVSQYNQVLSFLRLP